MVDGHHSGGERERQERTETCVTASYSRSRKGSGRSCWVRFKRRKTSEIKTLKRVIKDYPTYKTWAAISVAKETTLPTPYESAISSMPLAANNDKLSVQGKILK